MCALFGRETGSKCVGEKVWYKGSHVTADAIVGFQVDVIHMSLLEPSLISTEKRVWVTHDSFVFYLRKNAY